MIIVTGGAGMIGSNIVAALNAEGRSDIVVVDDLTDGHKIRNLADLEIADYLDKDDFLPRTGGRATSGDIEAVFHQGACSTTTEWNGKFMMEVNYAYSSGCSTPAWRARYPSSMPPRLPSTAAARIFARSPNASTRSTSTPIRRSSSTTMSAAPCFGRNSSQVAGLRYFNVYGPREAHKGAMASGRLHLFDQIGRGENPKLFGAYDGFGPGEQSRDFIHVGDVADINLWLWRRGKAAYSTAAPAVPSRSAPSPKR